MSFSKLEPLTLDEFRDWLPGQPFHRLPRGTCAHHTWSPTTAQWNGKSSMEGIRSFHMNSRGYSDIAANLYVGPDERIWTARPFDRSNWAHAYVERAWSQVHPDAIAYCQGNRQALNNDAIGVEIVGNYDSENPTTSKAMLLALDVFAFMHEHFSLPLNRLLIHRMVADKSCPGSKVNLDWFRAEVGKRIAEPQPTGTPIKVIKHADGSVLAQHVMVPGGNHIADQGKLYVEV